MESYERILRQIESAIRRGDSVSIVTDTMGININSLKGKEHLLKSINSEREMVGRVDKYMEEIR